METIEQPQPAHPTWSNKMPSPQPDMNANQPSIPSPKSETNTHQPSNTIDTGTEKPQPHPQPAATAAPPAPAATNDNKAAFDSLPPLLKEQLKFCSHALRSLKRHKDATPFLQPVDPVALNIPDYFDVIKTPMDFNTIQQKLNQHLYLTVEDFKSDVQLVFSNCATYNKPETVVHNMGKNLERVFDNLMKKLPIETVSKPPPEPLSLDSERPRRASMKRRSESPTLSSDVHAGPVKRQSRKYPNPQKEDLKYCHVILRELTKKQNLAFAWPFMQPVDPVALGIPDYYNVIKNPMDLSLVKKKLESGQYSQAEEFESDFRLMCNNCFVYNAPDSDVVQLCRTLESHFNDKWNARPSKTRTFTRPPSPKSYYDGPSRSFQTDDEIDARIFALTKQMQAIQAEISDLLSRKSGKKSKPKGWKKKEDGLRPMSFEEKRQLSLDINDLPPEKLGKVVEIIHSSMPQLRDSTDSDEIELDIDSLDLKALHALAKYVKQCRKPNETKGSSMPRSHGLDDSSEDDSSGDE